MWPHRVSTLDNEGPRPYTPREHPIRGATQCALLSLSQLPAVIQRMFHVKNMSAHCKFKCELLMLSHFPCFSCTLYGQIKNEISDILKE